MTEEANDGIVTVEETGPHPFVVSAGHTFIMNSREVLATIDHFLETGIPPS